MAPRGSFLSFKVKVRDVDKGWRQFVRAAEEMAKGAYAKVGFLDDGKGSETHDGGLSNAQLASVHEFGTEDGRIPERSFLRSTFDEQRDELEKTVRLLLATMLLGKISARRALGFLGAKLATEIKKKVTQGEGVPPPNAPATVAAKGSSRPLVDTGAMVGAVTWAVVANKPSGEE